MSLLVLGQPVTEAYRQGGTLQQDFDHMSLILRLGRVVFAELGTEVAALLGRHFKPLPPMRSTPTQLYFPQTHHTLQGDMLRFWKTHGGMGVFGAPISEVVYAYNGDGSGREYFMQWFQNARLERHPENHNPRYAILLGLLGHNWWR
jgi:hypothetical protein